MIYDILHDMPDVKEKEKIKKYLIESFDILLPDIDDNICDTQEYEQNLLNSFAWSHETCDRIKVQCYHYDIWAYAIIFYHAEKCNKVKLNNIYDEYIAHKNGYNKEWEN